MKITIEIKVINSYGQTSTETYHADAEKIYNNEWDEIIRSLIDESTSTKEF